MSAVRVRIVTNPAPLIPKNSGFFKARTRTDNKRFLNDRVARLRAISGLVMIWRPIGQRGE